MSQLVNQDKITLYYLMGESLCMIQLLEDALSHSITLKKDVKHPRAFSKDEANKKLEKNRRYTFGQAVGLAMEKKLYSEILQKDLKSFLEERNWLIHKFIPYHVDEFHIGSNKNKLFDRIKTIAHKATRLQWSIEVDLIEFSESTGVDMSNVRAATPWLFRKEGP